MVAFGHPQPSVYLYRTVGQSGSGVPAAKFGPRAPDGGIDALEAHRLQQWICKKALEIRAAACEKAPLVPTTPPKSTRSMQLAQKYRIGCLASTPPDSWPPLSAIGNGGARSVCHCRLALAMVMHPRLGDAVPLPPEPELLGLIARQFTARALQTISEAATATEAEEMAKLETVRMHIYRNSSDSNRDTWLAWFLSRRYCLQFRLATGRCRISGSSTDRSWHHM